MFRLSHNSRRILLVAVDVVILPFIQFSQVGPLVAECAGHCATSRKVVGSIPDVVIDIISPAVLWLLGRLRILHK
jgi:hypothetical protein